MLRNKNALIEISACILVKKSATINTNYIRASRMHERKNAYYIQRGRRK